VDFLNGVCTNMIDMRMKKLIYYGGNYDSYIKTRSEQETNQMKAYAKQQDEITHIKKIHRFRWNIRKFGSTSQIETEDSR